MKRFVASLGIMTGVLMVMWARRQGGTARLPAQPWTSRKKQRREARVAEARARAQATVRPPGVHVEANADPSLKVRLGDL